MTVDTACRSFRPIAASKSDTEPTRRQVVAHNKAFDAVCPTEPLITQSVATKGKGNG